MAKELDFGQSVMAGARIANAILREWLTAEELKAIDLGARPGDFCDDNIAYYGAFAAIHFREAVASSSDDSEWIQAVMDNAAQIWPKYLTPETGILD